MSSGITYKLSATIGQRTSSLGNVGEKQFGDSIERNYEASIMILFYNHNRLSYMCDKDSIGAKANG